MSLFGGGGGGGGGGGAAYIHKFLLKNGFLNNDLLFGKTDIYYYNSLVTTK